MLDVAGLVPGASEGRVLYHFIIKINNIIKGLGNKFLDNLRTAHVLLHIIDVSGRTNEKGEETIGYDPTNDVIWLQDEIHRYVNDTLI